MMDITKWAEDLEIELAQMYTPKVICTLSS